MHEPKGRHSPAHRAQGGSSSTWSTSPSGSRRSRSAGRWTSAPLLIGPASAPVAAVVVGALHEGVRLVAVEPPAAPPGPADIPLAPALRAPADRTARLAIERTYRRRGGGLRRPLPGPGGAVDRRSSRTALDCTRTSRWRQIGFFRQAIADQPASRRRSAGSSGGRTLNVSGCKRAKRFGTFGLTSYGASAPSSSTRSRR